jgi:predicted outer membrane lipoprotein
VPIFARHCRIPLAEAFAIVEAVRLELGPENEANNAPPHSKADYKRMRAKWEEIGAAMLPRFKLEADACIARHSLVVYGDKWTPEGAAK